MLRHDMCSIMSARVEPLDLGGGEGNESELEKMRRHSQGTQVDRTHWQLPVSTQMVGCSQMFIQAGISAWIQSVGIVLNLHLGSVSLAIVKVANSFCTL